MKRKKSFWRPWHKWAGIVAGLFAIVFCLSGIVLNHREAFSRIELSRWWMPAAYHYHNWNNAIIKGAVATGGGRSLVYGNAGLWTADSTFRHFAETNAGLPRGIDRRKISAVVRDSRGRLWCAALYDVWRLDGHRWTRQPLGDTGGERISDMTVRGDSLVVLSRSYLFVSPSPGAPFRRLRLQAPDGYQPRVTLLKTVWWLHSGELFGLPGRLVVDAIAVILLFLILSGIAITLLPHLSRRLHALGRRARTTGRLLRFSVLWHNSIGRWTIVLTVIIAATGMMLRPPLMVPLALTRTAPLPFTTLAGSNAWYDRLRALRYDSTWQRWILSTSEGFYVMQRLTDRPKPINAAPPVSPMGISVFDNAGQGQWLVGSFSGLFLWNPQTGRVVDVQTGRPPIKTTGRPVIADLAVAGSMPLSNHRLVVFDYNKGARIFWTAGHCHGETRPGTTPWRELPAKLPPMPAAISGQPMSLWNFALELHTGRCYEPWMGPVSVLFIFLAGLSLTLVLIGGWKIRRKRQAGRLPQTKNGAV